MGQLLLLLVVALTVGSVVFGVAVLLTGGDRGLVPAEPDGSAVPLPGTRPLRESDLGGVRFDTAVRGYRMAQVDQAMRRAAYDIGYKDELISVLEAEVAALRDGRTGDADVLRRAREAAAAPPSTPAGPAEPAAVPPPTSADTAPADTSPPPSDATRLDEGVIDLDRRPDRAGPEPVARPATGATGEREGLVDRVEGGAGASAAAKRP
jgi:DivIVA domain-containing protein